MIVPDELIVEATFVVSEAASITACNNAFRSRNVVEIAGIRWNITDVELSARGDIKAYVTARMAEPLNG